MCNIGYSIRNKYNLQRNLSLEQIQKLSLNVIVVDQGSFKMGVDRGNNRYPKENQMMDYKYVFN